MSLFQPSVLKKHLKSLDKPTVEKAYKKYVKYFHDPKIQQNIKDSKEEQFQAKFLDELFVNILDYTLSPQSNYNLATEYKNESNSKKADGAILKEGLAIAVIELKGTKTKDLESIRQQAFDYKANQTGCVYVITSNFEKLRFYINNAVDWEEFNLFNLSFERFELLYLCLHIDNVFGGVPLSIKENSIREEENITKKFYAAYSVFKRELYRDLVKSNMKNEVFRTELENDDQVRASKNIKMALFKKSQKLIDRFLFIFFGEDRALLPPNSTIKILEQWNKLSELDAYVPLYNRFKQYFNYLDQGRKGTEKSAEIFAYNGGLFKPDPVLDSLLIDDELLYKHTKELSHYDFDSQIDVNILGHIFENSLNEIESINAEIEGAEFEKQTSKRKKDGVFYTPKYITKYIVDTTIGKLCLEKKNQLGIKEEEYLKSRKGRTKIKLQELQQLLKQYREWLLSLSVIDISCGSGAFLNQALDFLIREHQGIDELESSLLGMPLVFQDIENTILEKNIYGVDLNDESVEIAKLSLWLRTAQPKRKLNNLSSNIKCGNSLIDVKSVAGEKAFNWEEEFPEVFANGGFDVVIGNPPYVNINTLPKEVHRYFQKEYSEIHTGYNDLMYYFLYKGIKLLNEKGVFGVITSNYFIGNEYAKSLRKFLSTYTRELINFTEYLIFEDANVHTAIIIADKKQTQKEILYQSLKNPKDKLSNIEPYCFSKSLKLRSELGEYWFFTSKSNDRLIKKIEKQKSRLGEIAEIEKGSTSGKNDVFTVSKETINEFGIEEEILRKNVKNGDILRYGINDRNTYLIYTDKNTVIEDFPNAFKYLNQNKDILSSRNEVKKGSYPWWRLERPRKKEIYDLNEKIIVPYRANFNRFAFDDSQYFNDGGDIRVIAIKNDNFDTKSILGILNSSLINWYYGFIGKPKGNSREYFNEPLSKIPICSLSYDNKQHLKDLVDNITNNSQKLNYEIIKFSNFFTTQFRLDKLPKKLQAWFDLEFGEFIKELNKAIKKVGGEKLTKMDEMEWMEVFETKKAEVLSLKSQIAQTDKKIDELVYGLYNLTSDEIELIENS